MAQYTVIQDIEAEDKLLGPLSLRQFIYAVIVVVLGFIGFQLARAFWLLALPFLPPMIFFGLLAAPIGQNQSSEVWLLAKIRFFLFPRKRIWDQTGLQELVQITVPKKIEQNYTKGYSQVEVTSRLKALANTLDTRGWAIKNVTPDMVQTGTAFAQPVNSDRLVDLANVPNEAEASVRAGDDVLDPAANPVAGDLQQKLDQSSEAHRQELLNKVKRLAAAQSNGPTPSSGSQATQPDAPPPDLVPSKFSQMLAHTPALAVVQPQANAVVEEAVPPQPIINNAGDVVHEPATSKTAKKAAQSNKSQKATSAMTTPVNTAILDPVTNTENSSIAISHSSGDDGDNEVVVSLR